MTLTLDKNVFFTRFASCVRGAGLLKIPMQVARRAMNGERLSVFPAGLKFTDDFKPAVTNKINLTAAKFFEGKFRGEKIKPKNNRLEERTPPAPNP
jgi:hypothetical protein